MPHLAQAGHRLGPAKGLLDAFADALRDRIAGMTGGVAVDRRAAAAGVLRHAIRIHYQEVGSGFPLLVTPGGGLNSRISNWPTAVFNAMDAFKSDFRCITMDQRNANGGESTGPLAIDDPWSAFAED
jgi:hypothetical protein